MNGADRNCQPLADHGVIGDSRTAALVAADGTIDWYCCPNFDSPSVFGALLGSEEGGYFRITALVQAATEQLYHLGTNVLITRLLSPCGVAELHDFMAVGERQRVIRRVSCVRGETRLRLECEPRFDCGRECHSTQITPEGAVFRSPALTLALQSRIRLDLTTGGVAAEFGLAAGERTTFVLEDAADGTDRLTESAARAALEETVAYWQGCRKA